MTIDPSIGSGVAARVGVHVAMPRDIEEARYEGMWD